MQTISSLVPNAEDLLALEVEEVAGVLLVHLNSYSGRSSAVNNGLISDHNFFMTEPVSGSPTRGKASTDRGVELASGGGLLSSTPRALLASGRCRTKPIGILFSTRLPSDGRLVRKNNTQVSLCARFSFFSQPR